MAATIEIKRPPKSEARRTSIRLGLMSAVALVVFTSSAIAFAQEPEAEQAMAAGRAEQAIAAWSNVLARDPDNVNALVGRATAYGWQKDWALAEADINRALGRAPDDLAVLNAAGYIAAWSGKHGLAERYFERMLAIAPDNEGAKKGIAYNAYWAGENERAANAFQQIAYEFPDRAEPWIGAGNARIAAGQARRSAAAFREAKAIDPANAEARSGLRRAYDYPTVAELSVWAGDTSGGGDAGLRLVELASWITPRTRVHARFDDGLSLDNPVLARAGQNATTYFVGGQNQFSDSFIGSVEFGYRDLPLGEDQQVYKAEGVYLSGLGATKLGGQISPHSEGFTDRLVYAGHNFRLGQHLSFEPSVYLARTGASRDDEWRAVGYGEYNSGDFAIGVGVGGGNVSSVNPAADGGVFTIFGNASARIGGWHRVHLNVAREETPLVDFTRILVGVTLRLPRN
ncbi:MAG: tetratricopeptide repeat protein [Erythrobacter sp.]|uniref:tetratricopeptide repeat protein n=1 Tax=Erythrobacter sp. TaxID=1042 RepID=UPI003A8464F5